MKLASRYIPKSLLQRCVLGTFVLLLLCGAAHRLSLLETHFAHFDDIDVAVTVMSAEASPPPLPKWFPAKVFPFISVPLYWTYPPIPFAATPFLLSPGDSYAHVKFWGRFPSFVFTLITLLFVAAIAFQLEAGAPWALALLMTAPAIYSREFTIMAAQMHPYAASAAAAAILVWLTLKDSSRLGSLNWRFGISRGIVLTALCYLSYQSVVLLPAYLAALTLGVATREPVQRWLSRGYPIAIAASIAAIGIAPAYILRIRGVQAIWWNAGPNREFLFTPSGGLFHTAAEAVRFLATNSWLTVQSLISPAAEGSFVASVLTALVLGAAVLGTVLAARRVFQKEPWSPEAALGTYAIVALDLLFALVLAGRLTLSPTRHLVAYLPLLTVLSGWGLWQVLRFFSRARNSDLPSFAALAFAVVIGAIFYAGFSEFRALRQDPFNEHALKNMADHSRAGMVVSYDFTSQLAAMPLLQFAYPVVDIDRKLPANATTYRQRVLFVSQRSPFRAEICQLFVQKFDSAAKPEDKCNDPTRVHRMVEKPSDVEVDLSRRTHNGTNGLFVTLVDLRS